MGKSILNTVIDLLNAGGVPAAPAQPEGHMLIAHTPLAAVSIAKVDKESATVLVQIVAPAKSGAERCQRRALTAYTILSEAGAECVQGKCTFEGRSALFCVPVTAKFYGTATADDWIPKAEEEPLAFNCRIGDTALEYVKGFSASAAVDEDHETIAKALWEFTLEELFPYGTPEQEKPTEPFALFIDDEIFADCRLIQWQRIRTEQGILQIRKGTATSWKVADDSMIA